MSIQKKREERIVYDWGNKYDPYNSSPVRNANPKNHKTIHDQIIQTYCPCGKPNCELDFEKKILGLNIDPPSCFETCCKKIGIHGCGPDGLYPVAEFMTKWMKKDPNEIYMKRSDAYFNNYYKLPFIFRPSWENKFHLHHWRYALYDSPEYTAMIRDTTHAKITAAIRPIEYKIWQVEQKANLNPSEFYKYKSSLSRLQNEKEKISRVDTEKEFWDLISVLDKKISNLQEV